MSEIIQHPIAVIEGRAPLPEQLITRQTYLPAALGEMGVQTLYIKPRASESYDRDGRLQAYTTYEPTDPTSGVLTPGTYSWRLRDPTWSDGDPQAYQDGHGYNSRLARTELSTRSGLAKALCAMELPSIRTLSFEEMKAQRANGSVFVKPNRLSDISENADDRARLVTAGNGNIIRFGDVVIQQPVPQIAAHDLMDQLQITPTRLPWQANAFHAIRIFAPLWLPSTEGTPAVELRLSSPQDIGKRFATELHLLEPELVYERLPQLRNMHSYAHQKFIERYGEQNYLAFDYLIKADGSVIVLNGLIRALTPNLEGQDSAVQHLAKATADVEVVHLAKLAYERLRD